MTDNPYRRAEFHLSAHTLSQCPPDAGREVAFVGRSNVGKSSVINMVTGRKALARISKTPGRTQQINYFLVGENTRLVDLPGYGFARVSRSLQAHWVKTVNDYLQRRESLCGLVLILDIRREARDEDLQILDWCAAVNLPVHILLNKADKMSFGAAAKKLRDLKSGLGDGVDAQLFSALKGTGADELRRVLDGWLYDRDSRLGIRE
ncbi:MAG: ribosome biogenesis GTP-binding protein YihA/YsxC [Gammaproteobacteria bacterium]